MIHAEASRLAAQKYDMCGIGLMFCFAAEMLEKLRAGPVVDRETQWDWICWHRQASRGTKEGRKIALGIE